MIGIPTVDPDSAAARDCARATEFWQLLFSGLSLVVHRECGAEGLSALWRGMLGPAQQAQFVRGLVKLGIDPSGPPAVVAGKYHYLTNVIGGLRMQYIEESPTKVWNRNLGPMWAFPGLAMLAVPTALRREMMAVWHPNDGLLLGSRRLGWVITKTMTEGDPYDEGYFMEYPRDIDASERVCHEVARCTPECDEAAQPTLDPVLWPPSRVLKARKRYVGGYVRAAVNFLVEHHGEEAACRLLGATLAGIAIQFTPQLMRSHAIEGTSAVAFAAFASSLLAACDQDHELRVIDRSHIGITVAGDLAPYGVASEALRAAHFRFFEMSARMTNGRLAVSRRAACPDASCEIWDIRDCGEWLW